MLKKTSAFVELCKQKQKLLGATSPSRSLLISLEGGCAHLGIVTREMLVLWTRSSNRIHPGQEDVSMLLCVLLLSLCSTCYCETCPSLLGAVLRQVESTGVMEGLANDAAAETGDATTFTFQCFLP